MARVVVNTGEVAALAAGAGVSGGVARVAAEVADRARALAPRETGTLAESIGVEVERSPDGVVAHVGTSLLYGLFQEVGTSKMPANPYLRPALDGPVNL